VTLTYNAVENSDQEIPGYSEFERENWVEENFIVI
jgi:hypothetical protein